MTTAPRGAKAGILVLFLKDSACLLQAGIKCGMTIKLERKIAA
jgi:hypothetical protein